MDRAEETNRGWAAFNALILDYVTQDLINLSVLEILSLILAHLAVN